MNKPNIKNHNFCFIHIPKWGGTSIIEYLDKNFINFIHIDERNYNFNIKNFRSAFGHVRRQNIIENNFEHLFTLIRDPRMILISAVTHARRLNPLDCSVDMLKMQNMTIEEILESVTAENIIYPIFSEKNASGTINDQHKEICDSIKSGELLAFDLEEIENYYEYLVRKYNT